MHIVGRASVKVVFARDVEILIFCDTAMIKYLLIGIVCMPVHAGYLDFESFGKIYLDGYEKGVWGDIGGPGEVKHQDYTRWRFEKNPYLVDNRVHLRVSYDITPGLIYGGDTVWDVSYSCIADPYIPGSGRIESFDRIKLPAGDAQPQIKEYTFELPNMGNSDYVCSIGNSLNTTLSAWVPDGTHSKDFTIVGSFTYQRGRQSGGAIIGGFSGKLQSIYNVTPTWTPQEITLRPGGVGGVANLYLRKEGGWLPSDRPILRQMKLEPSGDCSNITVKVGDGNIEPLGSTTVMLRDGSNLFQFGLSGDVRPGLRTCNLNAIFIAP